MTTRLTRLAVLTAGLLLAAGAASAGSTTRPDKPKDIKEIMEKGHKGKKSLLSVVGSDVKAEKWDDVKKNAEIFKVYGETIGDFDPPKGDKASWKKMTDKYKDETAALFKASEKKDAEAADKSVKSLLNQCKGCHSAHR